MNTLRQGDNSPDVAKLQAALNAALALTLSPDGDFGPMTTRAVKQFQLKHGILADGIAGPVTLNALYGTDLSALSNPAVLAVVDNKKLVEQDYVNAAAMLKVSVAHVKTVCEVEAGHSGFLIDGRPKILFERHYFYKLCPPALRAKAPADICQPKAGGYLGNAAEWGRMNRAIAINEDAALQSASWGLFQIMGAHWKKMGYDSVKDFVERMKTSEGEQLDAFVFFIMADKRLLGALRGKDWRTFARIYNGPAYAKNLYDIKLAQAFKKLNKVV